MVENSFDKILRQKFSDFQPEPPAFIWDNIQKELAEEKKEVKVIPLFHRNNFKIALSVVAASIIALTYFVFAPQQQDPINTSSDVIAIDSNKTKPTDSNKVIEKTKNIYSSNDNNIDSGTTNKQIENTIIEIDTTLEKKNNFDIKNSKHIEYKGIGNSPINFTAIISDFNNTIAYVDNIHPNISKRKTGDIITTSKKEHNNYFDAALATLNQNGNWELGLYAFPGKVYNSTNTLNSSNNYNFDFAVIYNTKQFLIQSGLSYSAGNDQNNISINYKQLDMIGSYNDVYDVQFDSINGQVVPTYFTNEVTVYDSVEHSTITKLHNSYKYLSVPLLIGYRSQLANNFTLKLSTGPIMSIALSDNQTYDFNSDGAQIISINNNFGDRASINMQYMFSAGIEYRVNHFASIAIEPTVKFNINNVYENSININRPYSFGLKTGILFNF